LGGTYALKTRDTYAIYDDRTSKVVDVHEEEEEKEEGLQGVFKRLRRNGHQLEKGLQMAQRGPSLK
jgi:hypothetical protein